MYPELEIFAVKKIVLYFIKFYFKNTMLIVVLYLKNRFVLEIDTEIFTDEVIQF